MQNDGVLTLVIYHLIKNLTNSLRLGLIFAIFIMGEIAENASTVLTKDKIDNESKI